MPNIFRIRFSAFSPRASPLFLRVLIRVFLYVPSSCFPLTGFVICVCAFACSFCLLLNGLSFRFALLLRYFLAICNLIIRIIPWESIGVPISCSYNIVLTSFAVGGIYSTVCASLTQWIPIGQIIGGVAFGLDTHPRVLASHAISALPSL